VRLHGVVTEPEGLGRHDHVCWFYEDTDEFGQTARQFLLDGLAQGERLLLLGETAIASLTQGASALPDVESLLAAGTVELMPLGDAPQAEGVSPSLQEQLAYYEAAVARALDDGYTGLRIAAEVTGLVSDRARWPDHLAWEHLADGFIAGGHGMATLCAYRRGAVADEMRVGLSTVHPLAYGPGADVPFRLFFDSDVLALSGAVDAFGVTRLQALLAATPVRAGAITLDLSRLVFVDAAGCSALAEWSSSLVAGGANVHLRGVPRIVHRVWGLLGFDEYGGISLERVPA
jgi:ABC-type transporter Mla MlaB component